jgi:hypothetical protein
MAWLSGMSWVTSLGSMSVCRGLAKVIKDTFFDFNVLSGVNDAVAHVDESVEIAVVRLGFHESVNPLERLSQPDHPDAGRTTGAFDAQQRDHRVNAGVVFQLGQQCRRPTSQRSLGEMLQGRSSIEQNATVVACMVRFKGADYEVTGALVEHARTRRWQLSEAGTRAARCGDSQGLDA